MNWKIKLQERESEKKVTNQQKNTAGTRVMAGNHLKWIWPPQDDDYGSFCYSDKRSHMPKNIKTKTKSKTKREKLNET